MLNKDQSRVIKAKLPIVNIAGPGSGKTTTMVEKILTLIEQPDDLRKILVLTFTNAAANEIKQKIRHKFGGEQIDSTYIGTYHGIFYKILNRNKEKLSIFGFKDMNLKIIEPNEDQSLLREVLSEHFQLGVGTKKSVDDFFEGYCGYTLIDFWSAITTAVNSAPETIEAIFEVVSNELIGADEKSLNELKIIVREYMRVKINNNYFSFGDILLYMFLLLRNDENFRFKLQKRFEAILVDEFQDTNTIQSEILEMLFDENNFYIVGDPYQSIYKFMGAKVKNIMEIQKKFNANQIQLTENYRSTPNIVALTNDITTIFKDKINGFIPCRSSATGLENNKIKVYEYAQQNDDVIRLVRFELARGVKASEIAVVARTNYETHEVEKALRDARIPFEKLSGKGFYDQKEVAVPIAILKFMRNPEDIFSFVKFAGYFPGIGKTSVEKIMQAYIQKSKNFKSVVGVSRFVREELKKQKTVMDMIEKFDVKEIDFKSFEQILSHFGIKETLIKLATTTVRRKEIEKNYEAMLKEIEEVLSKRKLTLLDEYLQSALLDSGSVISKEVKESMIKITTAHSAKGMEWQVVIIINAQEGLFPSKKSMTIQEDREEEKRLFYVAVSRAKESLYILSGEQLNSFISGFLSKEYIQLIEAKKKQTNNFF